MYLRNRLYREPRTSLRHDHLCELWIRFDIFECDGFFKFFDELHHPGYPDRIVWCRFGIIVFIFGILCCRIRERITRDSHQSDNTRLVACTVVKETHITDIHTVSERIASLEIAYTSPRSSTVSLEIIDTETAWFGFEEKVVHTPNYIKKSPIT